MFINAKSIVFILLLKIIVSQVIQEDTYTGTLVNPPVLEESDKQICKCLNNGQCYSPTTDQITIDHKKQVYCRCPNTFIGENCQYQAYELSTTKELSQKVNIHEYKYFYFEPIEQNMYSFSFDLCFDNKTSSKTLEQNTLNDQITFFITTENQNGGFQVDEQVTKAATVSFQPDECKQISIDYTVLLINKVKKIQKLIFAIKLGQKLIQDSTKNDNEVEKQKQKGHIKEVQKQIKRDTEPKQDHITMRNSGKINQTAQSDISKSLAQIDRIVADYHPISYNIYSQKKKSVASKEDETGKKQNSKTINDFKSKSPSKLKQNDDLYSSKNININFSAYPFMVEFVVFNILFSLTTLAAFIIVGIMIFIIRSRILGIRISRSLGISSRLINDLRHFDRYIPEQKFIKKERKEGDISPNSSQVECAICLVKFQEIDSLRRTPCSHAFHKSCIDSWCHENLTCPMCRKSLTQKNMMDFFNSTALELKNSPQSDQ